MWVFLSESFLSIVTDTSSMTGELLVRARRHGDIERVFPLAKVRRTRKSDYGYRATIPRETVAAVIAIEVSNIDYDNFKNSVPMKHVDRHNAYLRVWSTMEAFQVPRRQPW